MALTEKEKKQLKQDIKEFQNLAKQFASSSEIARGLTEATAVNMKKIVDLAKLNTAESEKEKKFREGVNDLSKDILENTQNIGTEEFKILDVAKDLAKARRMGDKVLVKQLKSLRNISKEHEKINKQISTAADLAAKPFEAIDSFIREIPVVGDFLAASVGSSGWAESIRQGTIEGLTSGIAENANLGKRLSQGFMDLFPRQKLKNVIAAHNETAKSYKQAQEKLDKLGPSMLENFNGAGRAIKGMTVGLGAVVALAAAAAAKMVSFANETGLGLDDMRKMGGALLINTDAVKSFANELGTVNNLTTMQALNLKIIEKRFGLSAESAAKLFAVQRGITGASMDTFLAQQRNTAQLARQAGVAPAAVFDDMAQSSEFIAMFSDATGKNMARAAVQARKMGINLGKVQSIAEGLLDFETSIEKQMEAQVLLGRSINLDRARTLFYNEKNKEGLQEVANQLGGIGALNQMDFIQRKAVADLVGVQVGDLSKIMAAQGDVNKATEKQTSSLLGNVAAGAAVGATLIATVMTLKAVFTSGASLVKDSLAAAAGAAAGIAVGGTIGAGAGYLYNSMTSKMEKATPSLNIGGKVLETGMAKVHKGEVYSGTKNEMGFGGTDMTETNKILKENVKESRMLREQNEFLINKLIRTTGELSLNNA